MKLYRIIFYKISYNQDLGSAIAKTFHQKLNHRMY